MFHKRVSLMLSFRRSKLGHMLVATSACLLSTVAADPLATSSAPKETAFLSVASEDRY